MTDGAVSVRVTYDGILPDLFREGQGVVAEGSLVGGVFQAREVLAKHDENYMPPEVADALKRAGQWQGGAAAERRSAMIAELGHFAMILALSWRSRKAGLAWSGRLATTGCGWPAPAPPRSPNSPG